MKCQHESFLQSALEWFRILYDRHAIREAWLEFTLGDDSALGLGAVPKQNQLFWSWCLYQWMPGSVLDTGIRDRALHRVKPARIYLEKYADMEPARRQYVEACLDAPFGFHEVLGGNAWDGFDVRDLLTGADGLAVKQPHPYPAMLGVGDILYGQRVELGDAAWFEACGTTVIPGRHKAALIRRIRGVSAFVEQGQHDFKRRAIYFHLAGRALMAGLLSSQRPLAS